MDEHADRTPLACDDAPPPLLWTWFPRHQAGIGTLLDALATFGDALCARTIPAGLRARAALRVAAIESCPRCIQEAARRARRARVSLAEIGEAEHGLAATAHDTAALEFVHAVAGSSGEVGQPAIDAARAAGLSDTQLAELVALAALAMASHMLRHGDHEPDRAVGED